MPLSMEEQGVYMRLLCLMWTNGGRLRHDDKLIARMLGIHPNKWSKIKPKLAAFLTLESNGYITQKRLLKEFRHSVDKLKISDHTPLDTTQDTYRDTPLDTYGVTPLDTPQVQNGITKENQSVDFSETQKTARSALDLERSSRSETNTNIKNRLDEESMPACGKLVPEAVAEMFIHDIEELFREQRMSIPNDYHIMRGWLDDGIHPYRHILPTVRKILARLAGGNAPPPQSWKYFAKEVFQHQRGGSYGKRKT